MKNLVLIFNHTALPENVGKIFLIKLQCGVISTGLMHELRISVPIDALVAISKSCFLVTSGLLFKKNK